MGGDDRALTIDFHLMIDKQMNLILFLCFYYEAILNQQCQDYYEKEFFDFAETIKLIYHNRSFIEVLAPFFYLYNIQLHLLFIVDLL